MKAGWRHWYFLGVWVLVTTELARGRAGAWVLPKCVSAPGEIRTPNLLIRSQMLYPLSYGR